MNVTLGIPRLQEILMTASKSIRTPVMKCPLLPDTSRWVLSVKQGGMKNKRQSTAFYYTIDNEQTYWFTARAVLLGGIQGSISVYLILG
jgi:hypothetical protein